MTGRAPSTTTKKRHQLGRFSAAHHHYATGKESDGFERRPAASPTSALVKARDPDEQAMIDEALARRKPSTILGSG